jgi:hypothetical protein
MADGDPVYAGGGKLATDLGVNWEYQGGDGNEGKEKVYATGNDGDLVAGTTHGAHVTGNETYIYIGTVADYAGTGGALGTNVPGNYMTSGSVVLLGVEIDYSDCAQGKREKVKFSYSGGLASGPHVYSPSLSSVLPTRQENSGIPEVFTNANATSKCQKATYKISCQEGRDLNDVGDYLCGAVYGGEEEVDLEHCGVPSLTVPDGWLVTTTETGALLGTRSNVTYGTFKTAASHPVIRT